MATPQVSSAFGDVDHWDRAYRATSSDPSSALPLLEDTPGPGNASQDPYFHAAAGSPPTRTHISRKPVASTAMNGSQRTASASKDAQYTSTTPEYPSPPTPPQPRESPSLTSRLRTCIINLGVLTLLHLIVCPVLILAALSVLSFLWFSDHRSSAWRYIVVNNHLVTVVTGVGKVLEAALQLLIGTSCMMLAALFLEGFHVNLPDAAALSVARINGGHTSLFSMLWKQFRGRGPHGISGNALMVLGLLIALVLIFSQTATVLLNTDIGLANLHGHENSDFVPFGFYANYTQPTGNIPQTHIQYHGTMWSRKASTFPAFAEYSEPGIEQVGVSDTGATLRAFLPYSSQQTRQGIQRYSGRTTVVDTRVTCQVPDIDPVTVRVPFQAQRTLVLEGNIAATRQTPRLRNDSLQWPSSGITTNTKPTIGTPIPITCMAVTGNASAEVQNPPSAPGWKTSLCQLAEGGSKTTMYTGGLISEFQRLPGPQDLYNLSVSEYSPNWGVTYLFLNVTQGDPYHWNAVLSDEGDESNVFYPPLYQDRQEWRDYIFEDGKLILSATLCYASFMTADIPVHAHSPGNRSEPSATFDFRNNTYTFSEVRQQLGQDPSQSQIDRGVLALEPQRSSWLANPNSDEILPLEPYIRDFANMGGPDHEGNDGNYSAVLWGENTNFSNVGATYIYPDPFFVSFYQDIIASGGNVAFALQSMYTVLAGMAYYDQLPQFDKAETIQRTDFVRVNVPVDWCGFAAVTAVSAVLLKLVIIITCLFLFSCRYCMLGNTWAAIAQVMSPKTVDLVAVARNMTDKEVEKWLKHRDTASTRVGLSVADEFGQPGIVDAPTHSSSGNEKTRARDGS